MNGNVHSLTVRSSGQITEISRRELQEQPRGVHYTRLALTSNSPLDTLHTSMAGTSSRRRSPSPAQADDYEIPQDYKPYVPVAKRRAALLNQLGSKQSAAKRVKTSDEIAKEEEDEAKEVEQDEERLKEKLRRERTLLQAAQEVKERKALQGGSRASSSTKYLPVC